MFCSSQTILISAEVCCNSLASFEIRRRGISALTRLLSIKSRSLATGAIESIEGRTLTRVAARERVGAGRRIVNWRRSIGINGALRHLLVLAVGPNHLLLRVLVLVANYLGCQANEPSQQPQLFV